MSQCKNSRHISQAVVICGTVSPRVLPLRPRFNDGHVLYYAVGGEMIDPGSLEPPWSLALKAKASGIFVAQHICDVHPS